MPDEIERLKKLLALFEHHLWLEREPEEAWGHAAHDYARWLAREEAKANERGKGK